MDFSTANVILSRDKSGDLNLFKRDNSSLFSYYFKKGEEPLEKEIHPNILEEYHVDLDDEDKTYLVLQDRDYHIKLLIIEGERIEEISLTEEAMPRINNLNIKLIDKRPHIIYYVLIDDRKYRIVHHYYSEEGWKTNILEDIRVDQVLNPAIVLKNKGDLKLIYNNKRGQEEIYLRNFNSEKEVWEDRIQLTDDGKGKLYIDALIIGDRLHLSYCEYEGDLVVRYLGYKYSEDSLDREIQLDLSNRGNVSWPSLVYHEKCLWLVWLEYKNIMSRFSFDQGKTWSPIYSWPDIRGETLVRYNYIDNQEEGNILNYSFGTITGDIRFLGFGNLEDSQEVPLKKNPGLFPRLP